jgi:plasmid stabilization system protein ParE
MAYDYCFTGIAEQDVDDIFHYIAIELDNPIAASAFMKRLEKAIDEITSFPKCGSPLDNEYVSVKDIRKLPLSNYLLYYRFDEASQKVVILRILYGKRDLQQINP